MTDRRLNRETRTRWIVDMLKRRGRMTAPEIGHQLGLSVRHAQVVVRELRQDGLIRPAPACLGNGRAGRRPTPYELA
jgi:predicted ArsR family transcriptional regulator